MKTLNTRFNTNNTIYNLRSVFIYYLKPSNNNLTIMKTLNTNLIQIILFITFEVYLFTISNLQNELI